MTEPVEVEARFGTDGTVRPLTFVWRGQTRAVVSLGRAWSDGDHLHHLVMDASERVFELIYSRRECTWNAIERSSSSGAGSVAA
jgi:hypothetical protein